MTPDDVIVDFVTQSNMIEGETIVPGDRLFDDHLRIARLIAQMVVPHDSEHTHANRVFPYFDPQAIHRDLMRSQSDKYPGELRQVPLRVGIKQVISPIEMRVAYPQLIEKMNHVDDVGPEDSERWCWDVHYFFEHLHPFWDGNGRVGRLLMNALRLRLGLNWYTVRYEDRFSYYRDIEEWEHKNWLLHRA